MNIQGFEVALFNFGVRVSIFQRHAERLFVSVNDKSELYFSMISFQNEANRVYVSDIHIVIPSGKVNIFI